MFSSKHFQYSSRAPQQACLSFIDGAAIPSGLKLSAKIKFKVNEELVSERQGTKTVIPSHPLFLKFYLGILTMQLKSVLQ